MIAMRKELSDMWTAVGQIFAMATVVDLGQALEDGMPCSSSHPGFRMELVRRHDDGGGGGLSGASELLVMGGHVGTHIDALCHAAVGGTLYGGHAVSEACRDGRFVVHGVETVAPFLCRGVLADVPRLHAVERLAPGYGITVDDLQVALAETPVQPGEVVLVRTGWPQLYRDPVAYLGRATGVPGLTRDAAVFLADLGVRAVGSDTIATDRVLAGHDHSSLPAHEVLLTQRGIHIIEVLNLEDLAATRATEFLFIAIPLKITGATGSPIRPIAVLPMTAGQ